LRAHETAAAYAIAPLGGGVGDRTTNVVQLKDPAAYRPQPARSGPDFWPTIDHGLILMAVHDVLPVVPAGLAIWEACAGRGHLVDPMRQAGREVIATDLYPDPDRPDVALRLPARAAAQRDRGLGHDDESAELEPDRVSSPWSHPDRCGLTRGDGAAHPARRRCNQGPRSRIQPRWLHLENLLAALLETAAEGRQAAALDSAMVTMVASPFRSPCYNLS
jgi:hypothetical protein